MSVRILTGDCRDVLKTLPDESVHCVVTSPPYWGLRDYGVAGQLGLESTPQEYVERMVEVFREVRRVLRKDGTLWLNLGDCYATGAGKVGERPGGGAQGDAWAGYRGSRGDSPKHATNTVDGKARAGLGPMTQPNRMPQTGLKPKDLVGIPWRVAFALQADGWYLRQDIIWSKPNPMPESVRDRCTKAHEFIFLLAKSERYYYDADAIKEESETTVHRNTAATYEYAQGKRPEDVVGRKVNRGGKALAYAYPEGLPFRNKRSVWTITTQSFRDAHFATFPPALIEPCILAGCPPAGKRCDCEEIIATPTGTGEIEDPSLFTGRAGMNRPRRADEGTRPISRREQRWHAEQMKQSPHHEEMRRRAGEAFDHYVRTDASGARPLPERLRIEWSRLGWITEAPPCRHQDEGPGVVLDPFGGAGTTGLVADRLKRNAILIELNPEYAAMAERRIRGDAPMFTEVTCQ